MHRWSIYPDWLCTFEELELRYMAIDLTNYVSSRDVRNPGTISQNTQRTICRAVLCLGNIDRWNQRYNESFSSRTFRDIQPRRQMFVARTIWRWEIVLRSVPRGTLRSGLLCPVIQSVMTITRLWSATVTIQVKWQITLDLYSQLLTWRAGDSWRRLYWRQNPWGESFYLLG